MRSRSSSRAIVGVRRVEPRGGVAMMHEGQRRRDAGRLRRVRHAREERQPLDAGLRRPGLRAIRSLVVHAGIERVADVGLHGERDPDVGIAERQEGAEESRLRDADHREVGATDDELAADDRGIPLEAALPVRIADHHDGVGANAAVSRGSIRRPTCAR